MSRDRGERRVGRTVVRSVERHADARGEVFEPLAPHALPDQRNVHIVLTRPGHVRGNHVHHTSTEVLVVRGPARVRLREGDQTRDVDVPDGQVWSFTVPPGVAHAVVGTGVEPNVLVAFRDTEHDPDDPDTERVLLIDGPPAGD